MITRERILDVLEEMTRCPRCESCAGSARMLLADLQREPSTLGAMPSRAEVWQKALRAEGSSSAAQVRQCDARHEFTGACCTLPLDHAENHRGPYAHGIAQWPYTGERAEGEGVT